MKARAGRASWLLGAATVIACAARQLPAEPQAKPAESMGGTVLSTRDAGFTLELRVLGFRFAPSPHQPLGPRLPGFIATSADELPVSFQPAQPVDFTRYVAVAIPGGQFNAIDAGVVLTLEDLHAVSDREIQYVFPSSPCQFCGGSSNTAALAAECWKKVPVQVLLIPRPKERLIIGFTDQSCSLALP